MDEFESSTLPFYRRSQPVFLTPELMAQRRGRRRLIYIICGICIVLGATQVVVGVDWSLPGKSGVASIHSSAWEKGFIDGRTAALSDAQARVAAATIGYDPKGTSAKSPTAPRRGVGQWRRDYQDGWYVGYSTVRSKQQKL